MAESGRAVHDVAVVGGGLIGAAAALGAARLGRDVLLVEPAEPRLQRGELGVDLRNVAISPASADLLTSLGVWAGLPLAPYRRMEVWEERGTRAIVFDAAEVSRGELGWIVENSPVAVAIWEALRSHPDVTLRAGRVRSVRPGAEHVDLELDDGTAAARLLIAADGADSVVRRCLGAEVRTFAVGQVALATVIRTAQPHRSTARQRFLLDGPLALLPSVHPRQCSVVWSQSPTEAERRRQLDDGSFAGEITRALQGCLGEVEATDARMTFPLRQQLAATFTPHARVLLIGDAARVLHPLAGLGGNLGFEDVREVLMVLGRLASRDDPGRGGLWQAFDRQRRVRARLMLGVMDGLRRIYAQGDPLTQWLRNLGVGWLDRAAPVKRQIMMEAMGLGPVSGSASAAR